MAIHAALVAAVNEVPAVWTEGSAGAAAAFAQAGTASIPPEGILCFVTHASFAAAVTADAADGPACGSAACDDSTAREGSPVRISRSSLPLGHLATGPCFATQAAFLAALIASDVDVAGGDIDVGAGISGASVRGTVAGGVLPVSGTPSCSAAAAAAS